MRLRITARAARTATARATLVGAVTATAGLVAGSTPAAGRPAGPLTYNCAFPSGTAQISVGIAAAFPAHGTAGQPLRPARVEVTLPGSVTAGLPGAGAGPVSVAGALAVTLTQGGAAQAQAWRGLQASQAAASGGGSLRLTPSGRLPAVRARKPGVLTVSAGQLSLAFTYPQGTPSPAPSSSAPSPAPSASPTGSPAPSAGAPTAAAVPAPAGPAQPVTPSPTPAVPSPSPSLSPGPLTTVTVACVPAARQDTTLAVITMGAGRPAKGAKLCPKEPKGGLKLNRHLPVPKPPKHSVILHQPQPACVYIVGYSDVRKLKEAALIGPGLSAVTLYIREVFGGANYFEEDSAAQLDYQACATCKVVHGLPPARATFLAFGFMPVQATMRLTEIGTMNIISLGSTHSLRTNTVYALMSLRVSNVKVDGRPLDVGPRCRPVRPILTKVVGRPGSHPPYDLIKGGPLIGRITIPRFTHCGVTENLDPILDGSISGPGNVIELTQGHVCLLAGGRKCRPRIPKPVH